jgi:sensor histidine kinase YesM
MVRKKMVKKKINRNPWFKSRDGSKDGWGFIPINWKGWVALFLLVGLNVFAANYFMLDELVLDNYLSMGVVFLLSIFVFIEVAKKKTK